ncbi:hypothetical protein MKW98_008139 [Papaver atlanticum]|uniref:Phytocyanin domain-containing protein n=1 Tax=Papaver atlanticum TaxID=357466 RepID=A0AAD4S7Q1_9MAGN|nr:hypothetical protein MKW98_008139 [Papaver atlanticum]
MGIIGQVLFAVLMVFCIAAVPTLAKEYTVGDYYGWGVNTNLYSWLQGKKFTVGDSLVFEYGESDSVYEVSETAYEDCDTHEFITSDSSGQTTIRLETPGKHYFISNEAHCDMEMKLEIIVGEASSSDDRSSSSSALL